MKKIRELAEASVKIAAQKMAKCPRFNEIFPITDITRVDALRDQDEQIAIAGLRTARFERGDFDAFRAAFRQAALDYSEPAINLEEGSGRFYIPVREKDKQSRVELKPRDIFKIDDDPMFQDVYEKAEDLFKGRKQLMSFDEFVAESKRLIETLMQEHPQLFDSETGEPLTPILPVINLPTKVEKNANRKSLNKTYTKRLVKLTKYLGSIYMQESGNHCGDKLPNEHLKLSPEFAKRALSSNGVSLYLPKLYQGYSLEGAEKHCNEIEEDGFELCDPLTGITALIQNLQMFIKDPKIIYKLAFHLYHRNLTHLCVQVSDIDLHVLNLESSKAKTNVTSGLIYSPVQ